LAVCAGQRARSYLEAGRENRLARLGVFVFINGTAPVKITIAK
jgi:hypothetical protein